MRAVVCESYGVRANPSRSEERPAPYDSRGEKPLLAYVPGIDGTGEFLFGTAARLERHFRLVRFRYTSEVRGPLLGDGYGALAGDIGGALGELGGGDGALLLAESFGVAVALRTALDWPDRVRGLALVNGFARHGRPIRLGIARAVAALTPDALFRLGRRFAATRALFGPRRDAEAEQAFRSLPGTPFGAAYRRRLAMIARVDLTPRLGEIRVPVALYASDRDRVVPALAHARRMQALLPDATLTTIERAGHLVLPLAEEPWPERLLELARRADART
ncbi:MAG TPA: hypothetical protein ENJ09_11130 [Planctomycetes bacterium]|nr:hypothetical protein [Planctomycetota bacterium]